VRNVIKKLSVAVAAATACVALALGAIAGASDGPNTKAVATPSGTGATARFAARTMYPKFDPSRYFYVARCNSGSLVVGVNARGSTRVSVAGSSPRSGRFQTTVSVTPEKDFKVKIAQGGGSKFYTVRCLPARFPKWHFQRLRKSPPGLIVLGSVGAKGIPPWVAIFDHDGTPRWWYPSDTRALNAQILQNGTIAWSRGYGDGYGIDPRMADEVHTLSGKPLGLIRMKGNAITDPHEMTQEPNGNFLLESYVPYSPVDLRPIGGPRRAGVVYPQIQELSPSLKLLHRWSLRKQLTIHQTAPRWRKVVIGNPRPGKGNLHDYDAIHMNAVEPWGKQIVVSTRHTDAIFGFKRSNGALQWKLGGTHDKYSLKIIGDPYPAGSLFAGEHDVRMWKHNLLSVFDNGTLLKRKPRGVLYRLDLKHRKAYYVGELSDPKSVKGNCCGSVRAIPGGWLVGFGNTTLVTGFNHRGQLAFRLWWGNSYRAVPVQPGRITLRQLNQGLENMEPR
jgi:hypothetical protein